MNYSNFVIIVIIVYYSNLVKNICTPNNSPKNGQNGAQGLN